MPFGLGGKVLSNQPKNKSAFNGRLSWGRCSVEVTGKASLRRSLSFAFQVVLQKEERGWQVRSFREPSLIVIKTGVRYPHVSDQFAGGLAKIAIEATGEESEVGFSFDFRLWYFSHLIFELFEAFVLFGVFCSQVSGVTVTLRNSNNRFVSVRSVLYTVGQSQVYEEHGRRNHCQI